MATTTESQASFSDEEITTQAIQNASVLALAHIARARVREESPESLGHWFGGLFAPTWTQVKGQGAKVATLHAARNVVSLGAELRALSGDDHRASATLAGWPDEAASAMFDLEPSDADAIYTVFEPIAEYPELNYQWQRDGDSVTMTFQQRR